MHFGFTRTLQLTKIEKWFSTRIIFVCLNTNNKDLILAKLQLFVYLMMSFRQEKGAMGWPVVFWTLRWTTAVDFDGKHTFLHKVCFTFYSHLLKTFPTCETPK